MKNRILTILLVLAHLPFVVGYVDHLRSAPAWHFGPLAWIVLAALFLIRNGGERSKDFTFVKFRVVLSLILVLTAVVSQRYGFGMMSGIVWLHGWLQRHRDRIVESSLAYLTAIALFSTYLNIPPVNWLLDRITAAGSNFSSRLLDQLGYIHLRNMNVVEVTGQRLSAAEFCNGFFSVPAFICSAVVVLCIQRRKWGHFLPAFLASSVFAVILQVGILCTGAIAWVEYQTAFESTVARFLMTGSVFAVTLICYASFDVLLSFITDPVSFMGAGMINPVSLMWNRMFLKLPREEPGATVDVGMPDWDTMFEDTPFEYGLIPRWFREFVNLWFYTRIPRRLLIGLPCLFLAAFAVSTLYFGESASDINNRYEAALASAIKDQKDDDTELIMARMLQTNHADADLRFRLVKHLITLGRVEDAQEHLDVLTPPKSRGHVPARMWLVKHSMEPDCSISLSDQQRQQQLRRAVEEDNRNVDAHVLLSESYARSNLLQLAEGHLTKAATLDPKYAADLLVFQSRAGQNTDQAKSQAAPPTELLTEQLEIDPANVQARTSLARIFLVQGQFNDAEQLLQKGIEIAPTAELNAMLSSSYTKRAAKLLPQPMLLPKAADLSRQAVLLDPDNETAIRLMKRTSLFVGTFEKDPLKPAIDHWQAKVANDEQSSGARFYLSELLSACGSYDQAADSLRPITQNNVELQMELVQLLLKADRRAEADAIVDKLTTVIRDRMQQTPDDPSLATSLANILLMADRPVEANEVVEAHQTGTQTSANSAFAQAIVNAKLAVFDRKAADDESFLATTEALKLIQDALAASPTNAAAVVPRLAQLTFAEGDVARSAESMLTEILAEQSLSQSVYLNLGTLAVIHEDYDKAVKYLETTLSLSPDDSQVLNNLAVALVRQSPDNAERALQLSQRAIALSPGYVELICTRAEILLALKKWPEAREDLETVLDRQPKHELAQKLLQQANAEG